MVVVSDAKWKIFTGRFCMLNNSDVINLFKIFFIIMLILIAIFYVRVTLCRFRLNAIRIQRKIRDRGNRERNEALRKLKGN